MICAATPRGRAPIDLGAATFRPVSEVRAAADRLGVAWWTISAFDRGAAEPAPGYELAPGESLARGEVWRRTGEAPAGEPSPGDGADDGRAAGRLDARAARAYRGDTAQAITDIREWLAARWRVVIVTQGHGPAQRLAEVLRGEGLGAKLGDLTEPPEPGVPWVVTGLIRPGSAGSHVRLAVLTEADLAGQHTGPRDTAADAEPPPRRHRPAAAVPR